MDSAVTLALLEAREAKLRHKLADLSKSANMHAYTRLVELPRVAAAKQRVETNEYGLCLDCGEVIDKRRLSQQPEVPSCSRCQGREDGPWKRL